MLTPKQKAFADYYIECGGGGEVSGRCVGTSKEVEKSMTIKDLYEEAVKSGREDYDILVQYQDGGGYYSGSTYASEVEWDDTMKEVTIA